MKKLTRDKNLLQPESVPNRMAPPRPLSRTRTAPTPKLPDFTEDPFKDYRYEDLYNIDPFADDVIDDSNANKTTTSNNIKLDPFGFDENSFISKDSVNTFDSDFSKTLPLPKRKGEKNASKFNADFGNAFSDTNKNDLVFSNSFNTLRPKPTNIDQAFTNKTEKTGKKSHLSFRDKLVFGEKKNKNVSNKAWNGNSGTHNLTEEEQFAWASEESIIAEKERRERKEKEDRELALALEISKIETRKSGRS